MAEPLTTISAGAGSTNRIGSDESETRGAFEVSLLAATEEQRRGEFLVGVDKDEEAIPVHLLNKDQRIEVPLGLLHEIEVRRRSPRRKVGTITAHDVQSFRDLVERYAVESTLIYADPAAANLTAVLNDHEKESGGPDRPESEAGWGDHRVTYACKLSDKWSLWTGSAKKEFSQVAFSEFLEQHFDDLVTSEDGTPIGLLTLARQLEVQQKGTYVRRLDPVTGTRDLVWKNEIEAKSETMQLPAGFSVGIPVFEGGKLYQVDCRMRFALNEGRPVFRFEIHRQADIKKDAFAELVEQVKEDGYHIVLATAPVPLA